LKLFDPGKDGVNLKGKPPSFRLFVVFFEHVDIFSTEILPILHRLFDPFGFRDLVSEDFEESRFATADVSLNGKTELTGVGFRVDKVFGL
jgi:hypothetical protein